MLSTETTLPSSDMRYALCEVVDWLLQYFVSESVGTNVWSFKSSPTTRYGSAWVERRYSSYSVSISALDGGWMVSVTALPRFIPGERTPGNLWTGGWVGPRAGLNSEVRGKILLPLPGIEPRSPGRPARSQTLYWLSDPAHSMELYPRKSWSLHVVS
jgi:hypothetical protein